MNTSVTGPVVVLDGSGAADHGEYLPLVEFMGGRVLDAKHSSGRISPLDGLALRADRAEQLITGMARAQAQEPLWVRTAGADRVATHNALVWALARIELAGEACTTTAIQQYLPRTRWGEASSTGEGLA